jgi:phytoene synthase
MPARPELPPTRTLAWLYASATQRAALAALCALEDEIAASLRPGLDHEVAHTRLEWWREECARTAQGRPTHPVTRELAELFAPVGVAPLASLGGLVDTATWDLAGATFETRRELSAYCQRWSTALIAPLAQLATAGPSTAPARALSAPPAEAQALGVSLRECELLLALASDARLGRLRLPLAELERAQVLPESLAQPHWPPALAELLRERHRLLRAALAAGVEALPAAVRTPLRGLIVWAAMAASASLRAAARLPRATGPREQHAPLDGWRAWRAARRVDAGSPRALSRPFADS